MTSAGATNDAVVQVALPPELTVTAGQSVLSVLPLIVKLTVPEGLTGASALAASWAVNFTEVPVLTEVEGEAVKPSVAARAFTVCTTCGDAGDRVKLVSPP